MQSLRWLPLLLAAACGDPARSDAIDKLGDEAPGVPAGPLHRPGQPCVLCHDGNGPGSMVLAFGGTVYQSFETKVPMVGAIVHFRDSIGKDYRTATNCAGNFFIADGDYEPNWPVFVKVEYALTVNLPTGPLTQLLAPAMTSPMYETDGSTVSGLRDRSCANCHSDPASTTSVGHVYVAPQNSTVPFPPVACQ